MKSINQYLGITPSEYEDMIQRHWQNWTEGNAVSLRHWQKLLISGSINRWFLTELKKIEEEFRRTVARYDETDTVTKLDYNKCFHRLVIRLHELRPSILVDKERPIISIEPITNGVMVLFTHQHLN